MNNRLQALICMVNDDYIRLREVQIQRSLGRRVMSKKRGWDAANRVGAVLVSSALESCPVPTSTTLQRQPWEMFRVRRPMKAVWLAKTCTSKYIKSCSIFGRSDVGTPS
jgi:hypothetical protein